MWSSWVKTKDTTQVMHIAKLKDGPKRAMKLSQTILERIFENVMMEGEKMDSRKDFKVEMFFSTQNIDFPFLFAETLGAFLFPSSLFFNTFSLSLSLFFSILHLFENLGILMINEEKNSSQISFQMKWNGMAKT
jgi:hypothetical protein